MSFFVLHFTMLAQILSLTCSGNSLQEKIVLSSPVSARLARSSPLHSYFFPSHTCYSSCVFFHLTSGLPLTLDPSVSLPYIFFIFPIFFKFKNFASFDSDIGVSIGSNT